MQARAIESRAAEKFAKVHVEMYVKGIIPGGSSGVQRFSSQPNDNG